MLQNVTALLTKLAFHAACSGRRDVEGSKVDQDDVLGGSLCSQGAQLAIMLGILRPCNVLQTHLAGCEGEHDSVCPHSDSGLLREVLATRGKRAELWLFLRCCSFLWLLVPDVCHMCCSHPIQSPAQWQHDNNCLRKLLIMSLCFWIRRAHVQRRKNLSRSFLSCAFPRCRYCRHDRKKHLLFLCTSTWMPCASTSGQLHH